MDRFIWRWKFDEKSVRFVLERGVHNGVRCASLRGSGADPGFADAAKPIRRRSCPAEPRANEKCREAVQRDYE